MSNQIIDTEFHTSPSEFKMCKPLKTDALDVLENKLQSIIEHNRDNLQKQIDAIAELKTFKFLTKVSDYLYEIDYNLIDYDYKYALEYFKHNDYTTGACSGVANGSIIGRNFDWYYNDVVDFVIRTYAKEGRHAVTGIAGNVPGLTKDVVGGEIFNEKYLILPFYLLDGFNDAGLYCSINVVPCDKGINLKSHPLIEERCEIATPMLPRYILDNFSDPEEACQYIRDYVSLISPKKLIDMNYEIHALVADKNNSYVLEVIHGQVKYFRQNAMTNFHLYGVTFNEDGKLYTPSSQDPDHNAMDTNHVTQHGSGLERWNIIKDNYSSTNTKEGMSYLMHYLLNYNNAYSKTIEPRWYTEFVGDYNSATYEANLTVKSDPIEFDSYVIPLVQKWFTERVRGDGKTWHTTHTSIYDLEAKKLFVYDSSENGIEYKFNFDHYYTASEIDDLLSELPTKEDYTEVKEEVTELQSKVDIFEDKFDEIDDNLVILQNNINAEELRAMTAEEALDLKIEEKTLWEKGTGENSIQAKDSQNFATGDYSLASGYGTQAEANYSHTEGFITKVPSDNEHDARYGHAEGYMTEACGLASHTEGDTTYTQNIAEHAEGRGNKSHKDSDDFGSAGNTIHSIGIGTNNQDLTTFKNAVEVMQNGDVYINGLGDYTGTDIEGKQTIQEVINSKSSVTNIENGSGTCSAQQKQDGSSGTFDFTGKNPHATALDATLTGNINYGSTGDYSTVFGGKAAAMGKRSLAEGTTTIAKGKYSHAEGDNSVALGNDSHAEGYSTVAKGNISHSEGDNTQAFGDGAHSEGLDTQALGNDSHAEGYHTVSQGTYSHTEGQNTRAEGQSAHAEGAGTLALGNASHTSGTGTRANYDSQTVIGKYNDNKANTLFEVGNGTSSSAKSNAFEVYKDGHVEIASMGNTLRSVATKEYVDIHTPVLNWGNITGTLSEQTDLNNELTNIREVAEGKTKTVVISYNDTTIDYRLYDDYYKPNGYRFTSREELEAYIGNRENVNARFNSQENPLAIANTDGFIIARTAGGIVKPAFSNAKPTYIFITDESSKSFEDLNTGDNILVVETEVPDRWFGGPINNPFYTLETQKIDLNSYATKDYVYNNTLSSQYVNPTAEIETISEVNSIVANTAGLTINADDAKMKFYYGTGITFDNYIDNSAGLHYGYYKLPVDDNSTSSNRHTLATQEYVDAKIAALGYAEEESY